MRYESPVQLTDRVALEEVSLGGHRIETGQRVIAAIGAANRDPEVFRDPDRLDLGREPNPHLVFGRGIHFCLGAPLARMQAQLGLSALLVRFSKVEVSGPVIRAHRPCSARSATSQ
jgi:cytochrome P450